jgi:putative phage-type endonuclease
MDEYYEANVGHLHEENFEERMEKAMGQPLHEFKKIKPLRTSPADAVATQKDCAAAIAAMMAAPVQVQRTPEWYAFRHNLLTASSVYKALGSNSKKNELICEKCAPPREIVQSSNSSMQGAFHHGIKYEPLSVLYYEYVYKATLQEFGCIAHRDYPFLGASPDGVNVNPESPTYGRAIEIKNPVSRVITGNPKLEYWVQVQLQLAVAGLEQCDFLETKFEEYSGRAEFDADGDFTTTADGKMKGLILYVMCGDAGKYMHPPFQCSAEVYQEWEADLLGKHAWIHTLCWKLAAVSCVLIEYNHAWFMKVVPLFQELWDTIVQERENGKWEARLPKRKAKVERQQVLLC